MWRMEWMVARGLDATVLENRRKAADASMVRYYDMTTRAAKCLNPDMRIFHNSGHIQCGNRNTLRYFGAPSKQWFRQQIQHGLGFVRKDLSA